MKKWIYIATLFLLSYGLQAQDQQEAKLYHSDFEHHTLLRLFEGLSIEPENVFLAADPNTNNQDLLGIQAVLTQAKSKIEKKEILDRSGAKAIRGIFNLVHQEFLGHYQEAALFPQLLQDGTFNCVTSTALFALLFDDLNIDYQIQLTPNHVFITVQYQGEHMVLETTDAKGGFIKENKQMENKLDRYQLGDSQAINQKISVQAKGASMLEKAQTIQLIELTGIHYFNAGINALEREDYYYAIRLFTKAHKIYPRSENIQAVKSCRTALSK